MGFPAALVGEATAVARRKLSARQALAFAAGLGADRSLADDLDTFEALPFYCASMEWAASLLLRERLSGYMDQGEIVRGVHASQDTRFYRGARPGAELETTTHITAARQTRAGARVSITFTTRADGATIAETLSETVYRNVILDGPDSCQAEPYPSTRKPAIEPDRVLDRTIPRALPHVYSECAEIWNPIHTEQRVARAAGLDSIILHGSASWALAGLEIANAYLGNNPGRLARLSARFTGQVIPGSAVQLRLARDRSDVRYELISTENTSVLAHGVAELR